MGDQINVTFACKACGGTVLSLPDDYTEQSIATCKACGQEFGRYGDIKAKAVQMAKEDVTKRMRDAFKGLKGWKVSSQ